MKKIYTFSLVLGLLLISFSASAATLKAGKESYRLSGGESIADNFYVNAARVFISGVVEKDLFTAGGNIIVDGSVGGDANLGGGSIDVLGPIGDDLRMGGGNISVSNSVGGDLLVGGGMIFIYSESKISGDALIGGGKVVIDGDINGDLLVAADDLEINGTISGDVKARAGKIFLGDKASIAGSFNYKSKEEAKIASGAVITGETNFSKLKRPTSREWNSKDSSKSFEMVTVISVALLGLLAHFIKLLALLLVAVLVVWFYQKESEVVVKHTLSNFWWEVLRGLGILVITPMAIVLLFISLIGVYAGMFALLAYVAFLIASGLYAGITFGGLLYKKFSKTKEVEVSRLSAVVGIVILSFVKLIPILGWLVYLVFFLATLGSLVEQCYRKLKLAN